MQRGSRHTPGPWKAEYVNLSHGYQINAGAAPEGTLVATHASEANAALIATAPDLLAACRKALEELRRARGNAAMFPGGAEHQILEAIAKAEGETP